MRKVSRRIVSAARSRRALVLASLAALVAGAVAVSATAGTASSAKTPPKTPEGIAIGKACGQVPHATIPKSAAKTAIAGEYYGFPSHVLPSIYKNWKPKGKPPYTVAIDYGPLINPWNAYVYRLVQKYLKASPLVGKVIAVTRRSNTDPNESQQTYSAMVAQKPNLIITLEGLQVILPLVHQAARQGIATISLINNKNDAATVDIAPNTYLNVTETVAPLLKQIGGGGNWLFVHAIPGISTDTNSYNAFKATLAQCPKAKIAGEVNSFFSTAAAKGATLQFISTHPEKIDAAFDVAVVGPSVLQAFVQLGKPVPALADPSTQNGTLGYWGQNRSWHFAATIGGATAFSDLAAKVATRMLAGEGPKLNTVVWAQPALSPANAAKYAKSSWTLDTQGSVDIQQSTYTTKQLDSLFMRPKLKKGVRG